MKEFCQSHWTHKTMSDVTRLPHSIIKAQTLKQNKTHSYKSTTVHNLRSIQKFFLAAFIQVTYRFFGPSSLIESTAQKPSCAPPWLQKHAAVLIPQDSTAFYLGPTKCGKTLRPTNAIYWQVIFVCIKRWDFWHILQLYLLINLCTACYICYLYVLKGRLF